MRIGIDMGHTLTGKGTGAVGILSESGENRKIGNKLIALLQSKGHQVINCTVDKSNNDLYDRVSIANSHNLDVYVSIHLNSGGGHGTETYCFRRGGKAEAFANAVNSKVVASCGFTNRGVKTANFYVIHHTVAPAILVEVCFVDSREDTNKLNTDAVAKAIAEGLTGQSYSNVTSPQPSPQSISNTVSNDAYIVKVIANSGLNIRKDSNSNSPIVGSVNNGESFTIVETRGNWGRLKSGAGWICLDYTKKISSTTQSSSNSYRIKVTASSGLNVRKGAGTNFPIATTVKCNEVFTIVETRGNWGKLKSGAGWICLDYTKRV